MLDLEGASSSPHDATRSSSSTGRLTSYFASSSPLTHCDTEILSDGMTAAASLPPTSPLDVASSSPSRPSESAPPQKKYKITASNGWKVKLKDTARKRIKREATLDSEYSLSGPASTSFCNAQAPLRRQHSRAKLAMLPSLPLDILFEVFGFLRPLDLLHLARTSKSFRALLLHRSATSVWKQAFASDPALPPCPEDVSLPWWASLAFDKHCQNCLAPQIRNVNFVLRVRYCRRCSKVKLFSSQLLKKQNKLDLIILQAVPFSSWSSRNDTVCTVEAKDAFVALLDAHPGDRSAFVEERKTWVRQRAEHGKLWNHWLEVLIEDREAEIDELKVGRNQRIRELVTGLGYEEELVFLDNLGRGSCAILRFPTFIAFNDHVDVKQAKPLTDKIWTNMKEGMVEYLEKARILRLQEARVLVERKRRSTIYNAYVTYRRRPPSMRKYPSSVFVPGPADFLEWHQAQDLIKREDNEDLTAEDMKDLFEGFRDFVDEGREDAIHELWYATLDSDARPALRWSSPTNDYTPAQVRVLQLAVIVFRCTSSVHWRYHERWQVEEGVLTPGMAYADRPPMRDPLLWYPELLHHPCTSMQHEGYSEQRAKENTFMSLENVYWGCRRSEWMMEGRLVFDETASRMVRRVLEACGLGYASVTVEMMDERDERFVCLKCTFGARCDGSRKVRVWSWRDAVHHALKTHFGDARVTWERISAEDAAIARTLEAAEATKRGYLTEDKRKLWKCMRCRDTTHERGRMTWDALKTHFTHNPKHGSPDEMEGKEEVTYYKALDYSPRELPPIKMIPAKVEI